MKRLIPLLLLLASLAPARGRDLAARLDYCADLSEQPEQNQYGRLRLTGEVFDQAYDIRKDLRILDQADTQWPFYLFVPQDKTVSVNINPKILNKAFVEGPTPHWRFDLAIPAEHAGDIHNRLEIITDGREFVRRVEIFRCEKEQGRVAAGYLIRFPNQKHASNQIITYPDSNSSCLHVKVYTSARNAQEHFDLQRVQLYGQTHQPAEMEPVAFTEVDVSDRDQLKHAQTRILDTGFRNRPVHRIHFDVATPSFVRQVSVLGRNAENEPWRAVGHGEIHSLDDDAQHAIQINAHHRWLKIHILNRDNQPLKLTGLHLEARPHDLVFQAKSALPARLCFRGLDVPTATYDLHRIRAGKEDRTLPLYTLEPMRPNTPGSNRRLLQHLLRYAAPIAIGAVSLLVAWIIINMMKRQHPKQ